MPKLEREDVETYTGSVKAPILWRREKVDEKGKKRDLPVAVLRLSFLSAAAPREGKPQILCCGDHQVYLQRLLENGICGSGCGGYGI